MDEVFLDYGFGGRVNSFAAGLDGVPVFVVSGLSKICGLPQMKAAWIAATGPQADAALERLEVVADTFLSMNAPVQSALPSWLECRSAIQSQILTRVTANLAELDRQLPHLPVVSRLEVEGGWYAILRIPAPGARRPNGPGAPGTRSLGSAGLLLRDARIGLAGGEPAGSGEGIPHRSNRPYYLFGDASRE